MTAWQTRAACRGMDTNLFMPERGDDATLKHALAVCATCPVIDPCRDYAVTNNEQTGVWGGTTERRRRILRRGVHANLTVVPS